MRIQFSFAILFLMVIAGCSGGNPVTPSSDNKPDSTPDAISKSMQISSTGIMGPFELNINTTSGTAELIPERLASIGESYIVNGGSFFTTQPCSDCLVINGIGMESDLVIVELGIRHPFEEGNPAEPPSGKNRLDLDIFDAALIVVPIGMTPTHYYNTDVDIYDGILNKQHGFTTECANITSDQSAMPYILLVDDSDPDNPGNTFNEFSMGASADIVIALSLMPGETLQFDLYLTFGYGASATFLERLNPQYYNPEFNRKSPWRIEVPYPGKWLSFNSIDPVHVEVHVYDWQINANVDPALVNPTDVYAASEIQQVSVEIPGMNNTLQYVTGDQYVHGTGLPHDPLIYQIPVTNQNSLSAGFYTGLVKVTDERVPQPASAGRDFLVHSPDGKTLNPVDIPEYATYQTFTAEVISTMELNPRDITPEWLFFYPVDICVNGNYIYTAGDYAGIHIFDISQPENPVWINTVDVPGYAVSVYSVGHFLYVADGDGLAIINIDQPEFSEVVGSVETSDDSLDVFVINSMAYIADEEDGLQIADISDRTLPVIIDTIDTDGQAYGVWVDGDYAYVADFDHGLQIIDVSTPGSASIINQVNTGYDAYNVTVLGDHAYVATDDEFEIININPPESAHNINTISLNDPRGIYISGDYAFVADDIDGMRVIDISNPGLEAVVKTVDTPYTAVSLDGSNGYVYLIDNHKALHVIDVDPLTFADIVNSKITIGHAQSIEIAGDYACVASVWDGLYILKINPPGGLEIVSNIDTPGYNYDVGVSGDYAYLADRNNGLQVVDISDPTSPSIVDNLTGLGDAFSLDIQDDFVYIADTSSGLHVVDISTPYSPSLVHSVALPGSLVDVYVKDDYACVAGGPAGLHIVDISTPTAAFLVNTVVGSSNTNGISCNSQTAVAGTFNGGIDIFDYNPPVSASLLTTIPAPGRSDRTEIFQGYAFIANTNEDLIIVDINLPSSSYVVMSLDLPRAPRDTKIANGYAYIACSNAGLRIIDLW